MKPSHPFVVALFCLAALTSCERHEDGPPIRVVLITLDTLRFDRFDPTQSEHFAMPLTRAHAERGFIFDRYYTASPVTQPAHATFLTGQQPWEHGTTRNGMVLSDRLPNIVEALHNHGFETRAVVASYPLTRRFGFARGFDGWTENFSHKLGENKKVWEEHWRIESGEFFALGASITDQALQELTRATGRKQFFWFHYFDPHAPYGASSGTDVTNKRDIMMQLPNGNDATQLALARATLLYDKDVAYLDTSLDRLLRRLAQDESEFETHVLVVSDHGESLGEEGSVGHGVRLIEAELHVPAFAISPRIGPRIRSEVASSIDVAPTLLSMAGVEMDGPPLVGRDLAKAKATSSPAFAMRRTFREAGKTEKRLDGKPYSLDGTLFAQIDETGKIQLGNHEALHAGEGDLDATLDATTRERILGLFRKFQDDFEKVESAAVLDPDVRRALEALGYVE